jgi:hypothetical protein
LASGTHTGELEGVAPTGKQEAFVGTIVATSTSTKPALRNAYRLATTVSSVVGRLAGSPARSIVLRWDAPSR